MALADSLNGPVGEFDGRVAVVTGGASGIGQAIVRRLSDAGAVVHTVDILVEESGSTEHRLDVRDTAGCHELLRKISERDGPVGLLVNAAAILGPVGPVETLDIEDWRNVFAINVEGVLNMMASALPQMYENRFGRIVNMTSLAGEYGAPTKAAYVATKHAVFGMTKTVALEGGGRGVTCNAVAPTWVDTGLAWQQFADIAAKLGFASGNAVADHIAGASAIGRLVEPDEVARIVLDIMKHSAMTGARIAVDGGVSAGSFNMLRAS